MKKPETLEGVHTHGTFRESKKRYNNYDLLRVISCISVIIIHVSGIYESELTDKISTLTLDKVHLLCAIIWNTLSRFAVPCFVMLSGAFLLSNDKNQDYKKFYNKILKKIGIPLILFSMLFTLMRVIKEIIKCSNLIECLEPIKSFIIGAPYYHLWYLYMIVGLYLLTPIVIRFKNSINKKYFSIISWIFLALSCISGFTSNHLLKWDIGFSFLYLGYFMIGYILKQKYENENKQNNVKGIIFIILGILFQFINVPIQYNNAILGITKSEFTLVGNFNPIILISAVLLFIGFSNIKIKKDLSKLSDLTFYIYIFHAVIIDVFSKILILINKNININLNLNLNIVIFLHITVVFMISYLCSVVWNKLWNIINYKINNKIDRLFKINIDTTINT